MAELHLSDFDGRLFRSSHPLQRYDGESWWVISESLNSPYVPEWWIGSTVSQARESIADPNVLVIAS